MTYTQERDEFIGALAKHGVPVSIAREILAKANRLQKLGELECSSEWANNHDKVPCPAAKMGEKPTRPCLCSDIGGYADHSQHIVTCGICARSWCEFCDPAPSALCHYCHGLGSSTHPASKGLAPCSHSMVPRFMVQEARIKRQLVDLAKDRNFTLEFQGDPRGCPLSLWFDGKPLLGVRQVQVWVPAKGYTVAQMERICR